MQLNLMIMKSVSFGPSRAFLALNITYIIIINIDLLLEIYVALLRQSPVAGRQMLCFLFIFLGFVQ